MAGSPSRSVVIAAAARRLGLLVLVVMSGLAAGSAWAARGHGWRAREQRAVHARVAASHGWRAERLAPSGRSHRGTGKLVFRAAPHRVRERLVPAGGARLRVHRRHPAPGGAGSGSGRGRGGKGSNGGGRGRGGTGRTGSGGRGGTGSGGGNRGQCGITCGRARGGPPGIAGGGTPGIGTPGGGAPGVGTPGTGSPGGGDQGLGPASLGSPTGELVLPTAGHSASGGSSARSVTSASTSRVIPLATGLGPAAATTPAGRAGVSQAPRTGPASPTRRAQQQREGLIAVPEGHLAVPPAATNVIDHFVSVIPTTIWLALAAAVGLAMIGVGAALYSGRVVRRQAGRLAVVSEAALTDPLTGVFNRRGFIEAAERELARARRHARPFVLAYVDVRGLKAVNDSHGHQAGDRLLQQAAALLKDSARSDDVVGRLGGDELGLLLAEQTSAGAAVVIDRIHDAVAQRRQTLGLRAGWDLTVGTASYPQDGDSVAGLLAAADRRLYEQRGIALR